MTCIVGVTDRKRTWIGGDSAGVGGWNLTVRKDRKVFKLGEIAIGFTSSFRMGQILRHGFEPPKIPRASLDRYMALDFVDALRAAFKTRGWSTTANGQDSGGVFLVGIRGRLFSIEDDYQVAEALDGFHAVGCGSEAARGALFALKGRPLSASERVRIALRAAERLNAAVRGPFHVEASS